jgi:DNA end-binding protein Ku
MPEEPRVRPFWSGTIAFGLVTVPVELMPAGRSERASLRMLGPDGTPLQRRYWCPRDEEFVDADEIVRGYEVADDEFVVLTDEELDALEPEKSREIDLQRFVPRESIDPMFFERGYFLIPGGDSSKAYRLLAQAMEEAERAGIGTFVMRGKEHLVAVLAEGGLLRAEVLRFGDEVRAAGDVDLEKPPKPAAKRVRAIAEAIEALEAEELEPGELEDGYSERLRRLAAGKAERNEDVVDLPEELAREDDDGPDVVDLMAVLRRRLGGSDADGPAAAEKRPARAAKGPAAAELDGRSKKELYAMAQDLDIEGRSAMTKDELIRAIRQSA